MSAHAASTPDTSYAFASLAELVAKASPVRSGDWLAGFAAEKSQENKATRLALAEGACVALGDAVGAALRARLAVVVIGERPGLSAADSLGIYLTYDPRPGRNDAARNCISNICPDGLLPAMAAAKLA